MNLHGMEPEEVDDLVAKLTGWKVFSRTQEHHVNSVKVIVGRIIPNCAIEARPQGYRIISPRGIDEWEVHTDWHSSAVRALAEVLLKADDEYRQSLEQDDE